MNIATIMKMVSTHRWVRMCNRIRSTTAPDGGEIRNFVALSQKLLGTLKKNYRKLFNVVDLAGSYTLYAWKALKDSKKCECHLAQFG